jgi:hypothetical protein
MNRQESSSSNATNIFLSSNDDSLLAVAQGMIRARRALDKVLPAGYIPDPVMDMLATLWIADREGRPLLEHTVLRSTTVQASAARRWILALVQSGHVHLHAGFVVLTRAGRSMMTAALASVLLTVPGQA